MKDHVPSETQEGVAIFLNSNLNYPYCTWTKVFVTEHYDPSEVLTLYKGVLFDYTVWVYIAGIQDQLLHVYCTKNEPQQLGSGDSASTSALSTTSTGPSVGTSAMAEAGSSSAEDLSSSD